MARSNDPNSGGSQFFICAANVPHLNGKYTVFGQVIEGDEIIDQIINLPRDAGISWKINYLIYDLISLNNLTKDCILSI